MRRTPHVVGPGLPRVLAGLVAAALLLVGPGATAARAHDSLAGSSPAAGAVLPTPPADVTLEFAAPPQPLGTQVRVTGPDGTSASEGEPDVRGATVVQPLAEALPAGGYTVQWRVTSADGHPISGTFSFTATGGAPPVAAGAGDLPSAGADPGGTPFPSVWIAVGVVVAVGGALVVRQLRRAA
ncbi:copper resistance CopC family protein [Blastococcus jejuensis]